MTHKLFTAFLILCFANTFAQTNQTKSILKLKENSFKEKYRKPVPLNSPEAIAISQQNNSNILKNTRATDLLLSASTNTNQEGEAQICINPQNPNQMTIAYMDFQSAGIIQFVLYSSNDAGATWTLSNFNPFSFLSIDFPGGNFSGGGDPVLVYDKDNKLQYSWIYLILNNTNDTAYAVMYHATSIDNGTTFTLPTKTGHFISKSPIDPNSPNFDSFPGTEGMHDRQWFAVDRSNGAYANTVYCSFVYFANPSEPSTAVGNYIQKKPNGSDTFLKTKIEVAQGPIQFNNVAVDSKGTVYVTGANVDSGMNNVVFSKSIDGGNTWSAVKSIFNGRNLFGSLGYIHDRENSAVNMVVDGNDNIHVVWTDFDTVANYNFNSYYSISTDKGVTFSTPLNINYLFSPTYKTFMPVISAFGNRISIGAYAIYPNKMSDYYTIYSDDGGATFGNSKKVSSAKTDFSSSSNASVWFGDYFNSVRTDTKAYHIWSDGRGTTKSKMYVSVDALWATDLQDITPINSSFQIGNLYPNPANDFITLPIQSSENNKLQVQLFDATGKFIKNYSINLNIEKANKIIELPELSNGNYYLKMQSKDGFEVVRNFLKK